MKADIAGPSQSREMAARVAADDCMIHQLLNTWSYFNRAMDVKFPGRVRQHFKGLVERYIQPLTG